MFFQPGLDPRMRGVDPFYAHLKKEHLALYRKYFEDILRNREQGNEEENCKILVEAKRYGLERTALEMMVCQWDYSDPFLRSDQADWVQAVIHRKVRETVIPDPYFFCGEPEEPRKA